MTDLIWLSPLLGASGLYYLRITQVSNTASELMCYSCSADCHFVSEVRSRLLRMRTLLN